MEASDRKQVSSLRKLYFTRTAAQLVWAIGVLATAVTQPAIAATLLVVYPLWDVLCTLYDLKTSALDRSARTSQTINAVLGLAAAIGIGFTAFQQPAYAIAVFGAWALAAGLLQLAVGLIRRKKLGGGEWAMILSGVQSTAAGVLFTMGGLRGTVHARNLGGYAIFGAVYFLIAGVLLGRKLSRGTAAQAIG